MNIRNGRWLSAMMAAFTLAVSVALPVRADDPPAQTTKPAETKPADDEASKLGPPVTIYPVAFRGEVGRDVSHTPLREIVKDARRRQPDIIYIYVDCEYALRGRKLDEHDEAGGAQGTYDMVFKVSELCTILTDEIRDDPKWEKKPRVVVHVNRALGPAAFFPWVFKDIYFTPTGRMGGIGYLDRLFGGTGDYVVREKQRSLRLAAAEGLANKGGYDTRIIRGMSRNDYVLSFTLVGGKPEYHEDFSGEELLCDGGNEENGRGDTMQQIARYEGNDVITLNAETAKKLLVSKGNASSIEEIAYDLGIARNYKVLDRKADSIFQEWSKDVAEAERDLGKKWRDFQTTPIEGNTPEERNRGRGKRIGILNQMKDIIKRYGESINPRRARAPIEEAELNTLIAELQQEMRLDKPRPGNRGR
jgi:hypothetical protein